MGATILAIDDTEKILDVIRYFLENEGYTVRTAKDAQEGLEVARQGGIDLILLDIMMPGMDGYAVCDQLKKADTTRDIPVIMLTAKAIILHTPKDFFYGLYGFLAKPFTRDQLVRVVADTLEMTAEGGKPRFHSPLDDTPDEVTH